MQRIGDNAYNLPRDRLISYRAEMRALIAEFDDIMGVNDTNDNDNDNEEIYDDKEPQQYNEHESEEQS